MKRPQNFQEYTLAQLKEAEVPVETAKALLAMSQNGEGFLRLLGYSIVKITALKHILPPRYGDFLTMVASLIEQGRIGFVYKEGASYEMARWDIDTDNVEIYWSADRDENVFDKFDVFSQGTLLHELFHSYQDHQAGPPIKGSALEASAVIMDQLYYFGKMPENFYPNYWENGIIKDSRQHSRSGRFTIPGKILRLLASETEYQRHFENIRKRYIWNAIFREIPAYGNARQNSEMIVQSALTSGSVQVDPPDAMALANGIKPAGK